MFTLSNLKYLFFIFLLNACQSKVQNLSVNDSHLSLVDGVMLYEQQPYSGILFSKTDTLTIYKVTYLKGQKHGMEQKYFHNGNLAQVRHYTKGKESGTHKAWWDKTQLMSEYHFDSVGNQIGLQREWHTNGQLAKEFNYNNGEESGAQKSWDFTGKIKANYVVINGERFGFIGSKNCKI